MVNEEGEDNYEEQEQDESSPKPNSRLRLNPDFPQGL